MPLNLVSKSNPILADHLECGQVATIVDVGDNCDSYIDKIVMRAGDDLISLMRVAGPSAKVIIQDGCKSGTSFGVVVLPDGTMLKLTDNESRGEFAAQSEN